MTAVGVVSQGYKSKNLDHLGLVSGMCRELQIAKEIDDIIPSNSPDRKVSTGQLVVAMILNGLGFTSKALYLTPNYFIDKPVDRLIGKNIKAEDINDDALGRALDAIFAVNPTALYSRLAHNACNKLGLTSKFGHLDSTSFHLEGKYNSDNPQVVSDSQETQVVKVTRGYSRDHRPEANQIMLNLIVENKAEIPVFMQAASGNQSDQTAFRSIVSDHVAELRNWSGIEYMIADSALYSQATLQALSDKHLFITRVPETIKEAQLLLNAPTREEFTVIDDNYSFVEYGATYGGVNQRWLVVKSLIAQRKELQTLNKNFLKKSELEMKQFQKLCGRAFSCESDGLKAFEEFKKKLRYITIDEINVIEIKHYESRGKPKAGVKPKISYQLSGFCCCSLDTKEAKNADTGMFILATNELDKKSLSNELMLSEYKNQQKVERGFKFLKNPHFFTNSFFVKKVERMMSLLMVMTLCLMVYAAIEYRIRRALEVTNKTVLSQLKKPTQKPTTRWIFECFAGIHVLIIDEITELVLNLKDQHLSILELLGSEYYKLYSKNLD
jgi:transposase